MFTIRLGKQRTTVHLKAMHSAAGTRVFKKLSGGQQKAWSRYDRNVSRKQMSRKGGHAKVIRF